MRLTAHQVHIIKNETLNIFGQESKVYLFGSRTDDTKKGGDIDLLICTPNEMKVESQKMNNFYISLIRKLGDQKIDILYRKKNEDRKIITTALETGIEL